MQEKVMKKFRLKGSLIDLKTGEEKMVQDLIIIGSCGNDAVCSFRFKLQKEGLYRLGDQYTYFEIGPAN